MRLSIVIEYRSIRIFAFRAFWYHRPTLVAINSITNRYTSGKNRTAYPINFNKKNPVDIKNHQRKSDCSLESLLARKIDVTHTVRKKMAKGNKSFGITSISLDNLQPYEEASTFDSWKPPKYSIM